MDQLKGIYDQHNIPPELIFNMDETMLDARGKRVKVITRKKSPRPFTAVNSKGEHITLVLAVSATGGFVRPLLIFPLKTLPPLDPRSEEFYYISGEEHGFIDNEIFYGWVRAVFIPHVNYIRAVLHKPGAKVLLLIDPHSTRAYQPALKDFEDNNIMVVSFLAHSSTISQPLDLTVNNELKRNLATYFLPKQGETKEEKRIRLINTSIPCLQAAVTGIHITAGFARAGIWPYSHDAPLNSSLVRDPFDYPQTPRPQHHRRGPRIAGRILSHGRDITPPLPPPPQPLALPPTPITPLPNPPTSSRTLVVDGVVYNF